MPLSNFGELQKLVFPKAIAAKITEEEEKIDNSKPFYSTAFTRPRPSSNPHKAISTIPAKSNMMGLKTNTTKVIIQNSNNSMLSITNSNKFTANNLTQKKK